MKSKEFALILLSVFLSLLLALGLIRIFAPGLLGMETPLDLQMVQVDTKVPPFFENVFRESDYADRGSIITSVEDFLINDPYVNRGKPLIAWSSYNGPHDILGFRNKYIPNNPDIITIGDSQTYGIISPIKHNWPTQLSELLSKQNNKVSVYNMAIGSWGAVEYLEMFKKAVLFGPKVIIVAFYTGNDPLESYKKAYSGQRWEALRPDSSLSAADINDVFFAKEGDWGPVRFNDSVVTTFTPVRRMYSNLDHPVVRAGYGIMEAASREMASLATENNIQLVFTIIPTKELVYSSKVTKEGIDAPEIYTSLVQAETKNIEQLASKLASLQNAIYVDLVTPLQDKSTTPLSLYSVKHITDGHLARNGSRVVAEELAPVLKLRE